MVLLTGAIFVLHTKHRLSCSLKLESSEMVVGG